MGDSAMERPVKYLTRQHESPLRLRRFQAQVNSGRDSARQRLMSSGREPLPARAPLRTGRAS